MPCDSIGKLSHTNPHSHSSRRGAGRGSEWVLPLFVEFGDGWWRLRPGSMRMMVTCLVCPCG